MIGAAAAAPAVPAAAITVGLIVLAFVWITLWGLKYGYEYTLGAMLRRLADQTRGIRWIGGRIASTFESMDSFVQARIADGIETIEASAARLWDGLAWLVRETADALVAYANDVHDAIAALSDAEIPRQVRVVTHPIVQRITRTVKVDDTRWRAESLARTRGIDQLNRDLTAEALARERGIDRLGNLIGELVLPRVRALDQAVADVVGFTRRNLRVRVGNLERAAAAGTIGAIAIAAMTRVFPYWRCTNVRRFNRSLCRMPVGLLDDLFGAGLALLVLSDVCRIGALTREVAELAQPVLLELVGVVDAATRCTSFPRPAALPLDAVELPTPANALAL